jgi:hypothetical protein
MVFADQVGRAFAWVHDRATHLSIDLNQIYTPRARGADIPRCAKPAIASQCNAGNGMPLLEAARGRVVQNPLAREGARPLAGHWLCH